MSESRTAAAISAKNNRALVGYLPLGYPDLEQSVAAAVTLAESGATVLELGIPYTDPALDGPVIQAATTESLARGFRLRDTFTAIEAIREKTDVPLLVMTYWNPVLAFGVDRFAAELARAGGAGLITPDLVPENAAEWIEASDRHDLDRVFLAAPSSSESRLRTVIDSSRGFVYTVSTMGTTGVRQDVDTAAKTLTARLRDLDAEMCCVGLGISTAKQVSDVLEYADGAIVGSAFVTALRDGGISQLEATASALAAGTMSQDSSSLSSDSSREAQ
ncbi:tryptophan synthase subunit alpha [Humidisolicoccus flavus]|uniref:tryptophan synthase subunit alpha n=1 Tax=Humidisolicoccus flavus TaxID=3111414 RepID=UPI00324FFE5B